MVFWYNDRNDKKNLVPAGYYLCYDVHCGHQQHVRKAKGLEENKGFLKPCECCGGKNFWK